MFIVGNFLIGLAKVIDIVLWVYMWIVVIRALLSWVNPDPYNPVVRFINNLTEPVLYQIRRRLPVIHGGIDLSPIIVFLAIIFLQKFLVGSLYGIASRMM